MNEEKKKEFEEKFCLPPELRHSHDRMVLVETDGDLIWSWIDSELKQARIEENKTYSQLIDEGYGYNGGIQNIVFKNRIKELEKEWNYLNL